EGDPGRQQVGQRDVGSRVGPVVLEGDRVRDGVADVGRRVADVVGPRRGGLLRRVGGAAAVVTGDPVELGGRAYGSIGGVGFGGGDGWAELQGRWRRRGDGADAPDAGAGVVGALAGRGGNERQPCREQVLHRDVGGRVGPGVGQFQGKGDGIADVGRRVA